VRDALEEIVEQSYLLNKREFANTGGQYSLQVMHWRDAMKLMETVHRVNAFQMNSAHYRDIEVAAVCVPKKWLVEM
jgi:hypothetical protein